MRFGHPERADGFAGHHLRQPFALLLLGSERQQIGRNQIGMDEKARAAGAGAPQFLEHDDVEQIVEPEAAIRFRHGAAQQPRRTGLEPEFARNNTVFFPFGMERDNLALDELADRFPENVVLFSEKGSLDHGRNGIHASFLVR